MFVCPEFFGVTKWTEKGKLLFVVQILLSFLQIEGVQEGPKEVKWGQVGLGRVKWGLMNNMGRCLVCKRMRKRLVKKLIEQFGERLD